MPCPATGMSWKRKCFCSVNPRAWGVGVSLNMSALDAEAAKSAISQAADLTGLPCTDPTRSGLAPIFSLSP
jgi:uncharacterized NAD-dependent epimerase/dehydratase family protein